MEELLDSTCIHEGFHSGEGRYDQATGMLRYVVVCDECFAEVAQIRAEPYRPAFDPEGSVSALARARDGGPGASRHT